MKQSGITIIEIMIIVAIVAIFTAVLLPTTKRINQDKEPMSYENTRCIMGYRFTDSNTPVQILDSRGRGIRC